MSIKSSSSSFNARLKCKKFWNRIQFWKKKKSEDDENIRKFYVNCNELPEAITTNKQYPNNEVVTARYNLLTFLPKNLFEQFRRIANFYFLCVIIVQVSIDSPVSVTTSALPLIFVVTVTAVKQGYEDFLRHRGDRAVNNTTVSVVRRGCLREVKSSEILVGDIVKVSENQAVPCDLLILCSSESDGIARATTANLDGETNLKNLRCPRILRSMNKDELYNFKAKIECDKPSSNLYVFNGKIEVINNLHQNRDIRPGSIGPGLEYIELKQLKDTKQALDAENLLLRGATLKNTEYILGTAVYTGQDTKLALNSKITLNKFSTIEKAVNKFLIFYLLVLAFEVILCSCLKYAIEDTAWFKTHSAYLGERPKVDAGVIAQDVFSFAVLFNYIIPISLYVTMEMQKFLGSLYFDWDIEMYSEELNERAIANTSDLNEELGQVQYLFTDKTGTLTENEMVFRRCSVNGICYEEKQGNLLQLGPDGDPRKSIRTLSTLPKEVERFMFAFSLCHSVQVIKNEDKLEYQASSPDEKALLEAASRCGVEYLGETADILKININYTNKTLNYKRLDIIEFSSDRRRMSVLVEDDEGEVWLYCKGAESTLLPLCVSGPINDTLEHVGDFARRGLRTLVIARRHISRELWSQLSVELQNSRQKVGNERAEAVAKANELLETQLDLLGASGVEDRLQPGVKTTLESLRAAGIKVWVLTGDKVETAVNVSVSCGHLKPGTIQLQLIEQKTEEECNTEINNLRVQASREPDAQYGLIVDGHTLAFALKSSREEFKDLCSICTVVLACRLSPLQKSEVVQLMKKAKGKPITAAVGDGANDVSMIQEAHVGIGVFGKEGRQAVRSSDFAVPRFHHLQRALLVHGHWYYVRVAILVQYFFYKNLAFITPQVYFAFNSLYSTQTYYDTYYLTWFNIIYTSLPILIYGLMEQDLPDDQLMKYPEHYKMLTSNALLTWPEFFMWTAYGLWHSLVFYYGPILFLWSNSTSLLGDNTDAGLWVINGVSYHCAIMVINLKLWLYSKYWSPILIGSFLITMLGFVGITVGYSTIFFKGNNGDMYMSYITLMGSPAFWLLSLVLCVACLIPDFTALAWQHMGPKNFSFTKIFIKTGLKTRQFYQTAIKRSRGKITITTT